MFVRMLFLISLCLSLTPLFSQSEHPFLLVQKKEYDELRSRQAASPWRQIVSSSKSKFSSIKRIDISKDKINDCSYRIRDLLDTGALLYIVDPDNRATYVDKMVDFLLDMEQLREHSDYGNGWYGTVTVGMAMFMSTIAYDVIYDDLGENEHGEIEGILSAIAEDFYGDSRFNNSHKLNATGACGVWFVFKNDPRKKQVMQAYRETFESYVNELGVWNGSQDYSTLRLSSVRYAKAYFMDVLNVTGEMNFYDDARTQRYFRFLYSFGMAPNGDVISIGDSHVKKAANTPGIYLTKKLSDEAAAVAAWRINVNKFGTHPGFINYVLMDKPLPDPQPPTSKIYEDGGAFFIQADADKNALYGALWNPREFEGHAHKEVNALHLSAYGEHILRNAGYNGWGKGLDPFSWTDINNRAWTANTVMHLGNDHLKKSGDGIEEGFTTPWFDYACGNSGRAISYGVHKRRLLMVHPQGDLSGYFIVFDELDNRSSSKRGFVTINWHPNGDEAEVVDEGYAYTWPIKPHARTKNNVAVDLWLATPPDAAELGESPFATGGENFIGEYLKADYAIEPSQTRRMATVIFPHDNTHPAAEVQRFSGDGYSGAEISLSSTVTDIAVTREGDALVEKDGITIDAAAAVYRQGEPDGYYAVFAGREFNDPISIRGMGSAIESSYYVQGASGVVVSPGTEFTIRYPGITGVRVGGAMPDNLDQGENWIRVLIPEGTFDLEFVTGSAGIAMHKSAPMEFTLMQNYPNPFNPKTTIPFRMMRDEVARLSIYDVRGRNIRTLVHERRGIGLHTVVWDGCDDSGEPMPSGLYTIVLKLSEQSQSKKAVLLR